MGVVNWQANLKFINQANIKIKLSGITGTDWLSFLGILGWVEGTNQYNTINEHGYIGIYQFAPFSNKFSPLKISSTK